ncbi:MAG: 16S rRNA (cytosine(967)-C(5))-methyltransferase RsmB [Blautia sp.]|nr:16S rRNA (cytosine(967)-C(5))-methyltransferase RsmB [Blautia sp.]
MVRTINTRELILDILLAVEDGAMSNVAIRDCLSRHQFLPKQDRAFITRVCEGTLEYQITIDYILDSYSTVSTSRMKPVIREILRSGIYQLKYMDGVPDSAVVNEAVTLASKRGFYSLKSFVNGVLRTAAREMNDLTFPDMEADPVRSLSVRYSMPEYLVRRFLDAYGEEVTEKVLADFLKEKPLTVRCRKTGILMDNTIRSLQEQGAHVEKAPYLPYALRISKYNHLLMLDAFREGKIVVQDVSSMLAAECASPAKGDYVIDLCAAPGGKSIHMGDMMEGYGTVDARDISRRKVELIEENLLRTGCINVQTKVHDATVFDLDSESRADIVLADVPCSGYGVIGHKPEIKYRVTEEREKEIAALQREILKKAQDYVKPRGVLVYSTCTIAREENEDNMRWFLRTYPSFTLESLDPYLPDELHSETTKAGYLQLLPGVHDCDGFFIARFRKGKNETRHKINE